MPQAIPNNTLKASAPVSPRLNVPKRLGRKHVEESFTGFFENLGNDFVDLAKGLGNLAMVPVNITARGMGEWIDFARGRDNLIGKAFTPEGIGMTSDYVKDTMVQITKAVASSYAEYNEPLRKAYNHPLDVFLDAMTIATLGGAAGVKGTQAAAKLGMIQSGSSSHLKMLGAAQKIRTFGGDIVRKPFTESPVMRGLEKVPGIGDFVRKAHLDAASSATSKLWNNIMNRQKAFNLERDLDDFMKVAAKGDEVDLAKNIGDVITKGRDPATLSAFGREIVDKIDKYVNEIGDIKLARGGITEEARTLAVFTPLRNVLSRHRIREMRSQGQITRVEELMLRGKRGKRLTVQDLEGIVKNPGAVRALQGLRKERGLKELTKGELKDLGSKPIEIQRGTEGLLDASEWSPKLRKIFGGVKKNPAILRLFREGVVSDLALSQKKQRLAKDMADAHGFDAADLGVPDGTLGKFEAKIATAQGRVRKTIDKAAGPGTSQKALDAAQGAQDKLNGLIVERSAYLDSLIPKLDKIIFRTKNPNTLLLNTFSPLDKVRAMKRAQKLNYLPSLHERHLNVLDGWGGRQFKERRQSFQKARTGASGQISDVRVLFPVMAIQFRQFVAVNEFIRQLKRQPFMKDITGAVKDGTYKAKAGTKQVSFDHWTKYNKDVLAMEERFLKGAKSIADEVDPQFGDAVRRSLTGDTAEILRRSAVGQRVNTIYEIPETVANVLEGQLGRTNPYVKFIFDTPIDLLRATALAANPMWYAGNAYGNAILNLLGGVSMFSYFRGSRASLRKMVPKKMYDEVEGLLATSFTSAERAASATGISRNPVVRAALRFNEGIEDYFRRVAFIDALSKESVKRGLLKTSNSFINSEKQLGRAFATIFDESVERSGKTVDGKAVGPVLGFKPDSAVLKAVDAVDDTLFNYANLHPIERYGLRRAIPFWTWLKNIHKLVLTLPVKRPITAKLGLMSADLNRNNLVTMALDVADDDMLPDWLEGHIPVGAFEDGSFAFISLRGLNPFNSFGTFFQGLSSDALRRTRDAASGALNPIIKATVETIGGREVWSKRDMKAGEPMWDYGGRQYAIGSDRGRTLVSRSVPGRGFFTNFAMQYPQMKVFDGLIANYRVDRSGVREDKPAVDSNGNLVWPAKWWETASRMVFLNAKQINFKDLDRRKKKARVRFVRDLIGKMKKAPPDLRLFYKNAIKDAVQNRALFEGFSGIDAERPSAPGSP